MIRTFPRVLSTCLCLLAAGIGAARAEWNAEEADAYLLSVKDKWKSLPYSEKASGPASNWVQLWVHLGEDPLELFCLRTECLPDRPEAQGPVPLFALEPAEKAKKMGDGFNESYVLTFPRVVLSPYFIAGFDASGLARLLPQKQSVERQPEVTRGKVIDCRDCHPDTDAWSGSSDLRALFGKIEFQPTKSKDKPQKDALLRFLTERITPYALSRKDQPSWKSKPHVMASPDWFRDFIYGPKYGANQLTPNGALQVIIEAPTAVNRSVPLTHDGRTQTPTASSPDSVEGMDQ